MEIDPGSERDRCSRCGGFRSLGHARGSGCQTQQPGLNWTISEATLRALDEIDANQREAWRRAPTTFFD